MLNSSEMQAKRLFESVLLIEKIGLIRHGVIVSWMWDSDGAAIFHDGAFMYRLNYDNYCIIRYLQALQEDETALMGFIRQLICGY